ncbi:glutamate--cysteine ligase [Georgenia thermotolerans]|uniref:Putative glutamate--cysteine ligase 2 n=1 Tax=Georgenia thermotolerans TaxID=527326 RepID=A0A7J5UK09_9MICO|nr:glutamate--cysteine ligase [Georgenia thermotolerans]KAE8762223.1 YbdK family carboxylate-amine ligase [Georgenia thermotolerans]
MRTVGVEEELFLVEVGSGRALGAAGRVLAQAEASGTVRLPGDGPGGELVHEMSEQQVEADTRPHTSMAALEAELRAWRATTAEAARAVGVAVAALGTYPAAVEPQVVRSPRYVAMIERFGMVGRQHLSSGCHVHVSVTDAEEAVAALDRVRVWLPVLLALTGNSPFWQGEDTGFASYRNLVMHRWPSTGPIETQGSAAAYESLVAQMVATGVLLDRGMIYFDARASHRFPTVEIRIADVCLHAADGAMVAALCRALVETAAQEWAAGEPPPPMPGVVLRLATWQAAREGLDGVLLDPLTALPRPATEVVTALLEHVRPALRGLGDEALVEARMATVLRRGTGARRQREVLRRTGNLAAVIDDAVQVTAGATD